MARKPRSKTQVRSTDEGDGGSTAVAAPLGAFEGGLILCDMFVGIAGSIRFEKSCIILESHDSIQLTPAASGLVSPFQGLRGLWQFEMKSIRSHIIMEICAGVRFAF